MTRESLIALLVECPLVASVQADPGTPCAEPETLRRLAQASLDQGVRVLRLQGVDNIRVVKGGTGAPTIGLIKRVYESSEVYITPTFEEVDALLALGCEVVALDGTQRARPGGVTVPELIERIHAGGALAMADCDCLQSARYSEASGADLVGTTLAGYTKERARSEGPDLDLLREVKANVAVPIIAEGRYSQRWQAEAALLVGATGVVIGGAINDPIKQTRALKPRFPSPQALSARRLASGANTPNTPDSPNSPNTAPLAPPHLKVGAVDIGGTWLRFGLFSEDWQIVSIDRTPNPKNRKALIQWIRERVAESGVCRLGVGTGGVVDPRTGEVWTAKEYLMPDHIGVVFSEETTGVPTFAHGDGHATAWGHACLPQYAGKRVATLALGTGLGAGFVESGRIWAGPRGEYPRVNDQPTSTGKSYEELLGGIHISHELTDETRAAAIEALEGAIKLTRDLYFPDEIVVCGSVGLSPWLAPHLDRLGAVPSPFGSDAGLYGAAALALYPPQ